MSPRGKRTPRRAPKGRAIVAVGLLVFVVTAAAVIWRRSVGIGHARELRQLDAKRLQLEAERAQLEGAVRLAASRGRIAGTAQERLGMRVPADTQVVILARPTPVPRASAGDTAP